MTLRPDLHAMRLVQRAESIHRVRLCETDDGKLVAMPAGRVPKELAQELAGSKHAVLAYLRSRGRIGCLLDRMPFDHVRLDLLDQVIEIMAEREECQGNSPQEAAAIGWDWLMREIERRAGTHEEGQSRTGCYGSFPQGPAANGNGKGHNSHTETIVNSITTTPPCGAPGQANGHGEPQESHAETNLESIVVRTPAGQRTGRPAADNAHKGDV